MKYLILVVALATIVGGGAWYGAASFDPPTVIEPVVGNTTPAVVFSESAVLVELARSRAERIRGLSGRQSLASDSGLLFVFEEPGPQGIWMKEMNFAIDIVWLNKEGVVVHIEAWVSPESYPDVFESPEPAQYVLEMNAGSVDNLGLMVGDSGRFENIISSL